MEVFVTDKYLLNLTRTSFTAMQASIGRWTDKTFPSHHDADGKPNPRGPIYHLASPKYGEAKELLDAFTAGKPIDKELADCAVLVFVIAHLSGISLYDAVIAKMDENLTRKWGPPNEDGVCEHIEEPGRCGTCGAEMRYRPKDATRQPSGYWYCPACAYRVTLVGGAD